MEPIEFNYLGRRMSIQFISNEDGANEVLSIYLRVLEGATLTREESKRVSSVAKLALERTGFNTDDWKEFFNDE
jgi:hypothetical protein